MRSGEKNETERGALEEDMWLRKILYVYQLRKNQWLKRSELQKLQRKKLGAIIKHAYSNIEFYNRRFKAAGVKPDDIRTVEDLSKIPVTTKSDIRDSFRTGVILDKNVDLSRCHLVKTSGTSGEPLTIVYDEKADDFEKAVAVRSFMEIGVRFRDKNAVITSPRHASEKLWFQQLGFWSPIYLSVFDSPEQHLSILENVKPDAIGAPSYSLMLLAKAIQERGTRRIHPRVVYGSSEPLSGRVRRFIDSTFGLEMFDLFGCVEVGRTSWECEEHIGYHMDVDAVVMEVVDDNGEQVAPGEQGRILYTSLYNYAMPLIRYDVHDMCTLTDDSCPCGRGLPLMKDIVGRTDDLIVAPDGRILPPGVWSIIMRAIPGILQYRIVQETTRKLVVELIGDSDLSPSTPVQVQDELEKILGEDSEVEVKLVEEIPKDKAGKLRSIISKVRSGVVVQ